MQFFVGIDVSLDNLSICAIDERGVIIEEGKTDSNPTAIAHCVRHKGRKIEHVGIETGSLSQWLHAGLSHEGFRVRVMEARYVRGLRCNAAEDGRQRRAGHHAAGSPRMVQSGTRQSALGAGDPHSPCGASLSRP